MNKKYLLFDWGDTLMVDFKDYSGPMAKWPEVAWINGAKEALNKLYKDYYCVIASNSGDSDKELLLKAFERVNGHHFIHKIFASRDIGYEKPNPDFYRFILNSLNITACETLMVGNDYLKDIKAAKIAGIKTIFLTNSNDIESYPEADILIDSMDKLPDAVKELFSKK